MNAMDVIPYETGAYYVFDSGYVDYNIPTGQNPCKRAIYKSGLQ
jgi:hypothetical protein